jgi:hypothetical protein
MAFPNEWLEERIRGLSPLCFASMWGLICFLGPIMPRQYVALIEELLHAAYLPDKARRYISASSSLVKKMRELYQEKVITYVKDHIIVLLSSFYLSFMSLI